MKVKIITDRRPFIDGAKAMKGEEFEVDAEAAVSYTHLTLPTTPYV